MKQGTVALAVFGLGVVLVVVSFVWPALGTSASGWTEQDGQNFEEVKLKRNQLHYKVSGSGRGEVIHGAQTAGGDALVAVRKEYEQVDQEYNRLQERLNSAKDRPHAWATIFKWSGITLAVVGAVLLASQSGGD